MPERTGSGPLARYAVAVALLPGAFAAIWAAAGSFQLAAVWVIGLSTGFAVQRSRFCFVGAFQDAYLFGLNRLASAVVALTALASVGFAVVQLVRGGVASADLMAALPPGNIFPVGLHTAVGGLLFGLGMALAGSCALTTLTRIGEGAAVGLFALGGLVLGGAAGRRLTAWWTAHVGAGAVVHLPTAVGWPLALVIQGTVLGAALYWLNHGRVGDSDLRIDESRGD